MKLTEVPEELILIILSYDGRIKYKDGKYVNIIHKNDERYNIITPIISKKIKIMQKIKFSESGFYFDSGFNLSEFESKINHSSVLCIPILEHDNYLNLYKERSHLREKLLSKLPQYGLNRLKKENTVKRYS